MAKTTPRLGKKIPPFFAGLCGFTNYYGLPFLYCYCKNIVLHEDPKNTGEATSFAISNILISLPLVTAPIAMYRVAKRIQKHYITEHNALRGDPESDEIDWYAGSYSVPAGADKELRTDYYREEPRKDFWGGKPWVALFSLFFPPLTMLTLPSFYFQAQRSLNNHWKYHRRLAERDEQQSDPKQPEETGPEDK